jgi:hypothetical protein
MDNPDRNWFWRRTASTLAVLTVVGFAAIPILLATDALPKPVSRTTHATAPPGHLLTQSHP